MLLGARPAIRHNLSSILYRACDGLTCRPVRPSANAVERVWLQRRERFPSHRLWPTYSDILDACCTAWDALLNQTGRTRSLCTPRLGRTGQFLMGLV